MKKKIFIIAGTMVLLFLLAALLIPLFININHFKPIIQKTLRDQLNADISLGNLELSLIKGIGVKVEGLSISNPPYFPQSESLLEAKKITIHLGTIRSLFGSPKITIHLEEPKIKVFMGQEGALNIEKLLKVTSPKPSPLPSGFLGAFIAKSRLYLKLTDAQFFYIKPDGKSHLAKNLDLRLGPLSFHDPIKLTAQAFLEPIQEKTISLEGPFSLTLNVSNPFQDKEKINFELSTNLNELSLSSPWFSKTKGETLSANIKGDYRKEALFIKILKLHHLWGMLDLKGTIQDLKTTPSFQSDLSLTVITPPSDKEPSQKPPFESDTTLSLSSQGTLKPFLVKTASGEIDIKKLSGKIPGFLQALLSRKNINAQGRGSIKGKGAFKIRDNKPTQIEFRDTEFDLTPFWLNYQDRWSKPENQKLICKLSGTIKEGIDGKEITLSPSSVQLDQMVLQLEGNAEIAKVKEASIFKFTLATNSFPIELFKPYFPKLPFHVKGEVQLPKLSLSGNPTNPSEWNIQGELSAPRGHLEFKPPYSKRKEWRAAGPIAFSLHSSFAISQKQIQELKLNSKADFTEATLSFKNQFLKPKQKKCALSVTSHLEKDTLTFSDIKLAFHNMDIKAQGALAHVSAQKKRLLNVMLHTEPFLLSEWNQFFPAIQKPFEGEAHIHALNISLPLSAPRDLNLDAAIDLKNVSGELPENLIHSKTFALEGPFKIDLKSNINMVKQEIKKLDLHGNIDFTDTKIVFKESFEKQKQVPLLMSFDTQSGEDRLDIRNIKFILKDLEANLTGQATHVSKNPFYDINITTSNFSIDNFSTFLPKWRNKNLSGNLRLDAKLKGNPTQKETPLFLTFRANSTELQYLPSSPDSSMETPASESTSPDLSGVSQRKKKSSPFYQSPFFKRLKAKGEINITKASFKTYKFWDIRSSLNLMSRILTISPLTFQLYDGKFTSTTKVDFNKTPVFTQFQTSLKQLNIEKFLASQKSKAQGKLSGSLHADISLTLSDLTAEQMKNSLAGNGKINIYNGTFKIFNLSEALAGVPFLHKIAPGFNISDEFEAMQSSLIIQNQKVVTPDILLKGKRHLLKSNGTIGFDGSLDYEGSYYLATQEDPQKLIPFTVTGTLSHPKPSPDFGKLLGAKVKGVLEDILSPLPKEAPQEKKESPKTIIDDILEGPIFENK